MSHVRRTLKKALVCETLAETQYASAFCAGCGEHLSVCDCYRSTRETKLSKLALQKVLESGPKRIGSSVSKKANNTKQPVKTKLPVKTVQITPQQPQQPSLEDLVNDVLFKLPGIINPRILLFGNEVYLHPTITVEEITIAAIAADLASANGHSTVNGVGVDANIEKYLMSI